MTRGKRILVVARRGGHPRRLATLLEKEGYDVGVARRPGGSAHPVRGRPYDVVLLDLMLPDRPVPRTPAGESGAERPGRRRRDRDAYSSIEGAIVAIANGAFNYIPSRPEPGSEITVRKGSEGEALTEENAG